MVFKLCCVPVCKNTTQNEPTKLFLSAPKQPKRRQNWAYAMKLPNIPTHGQYCVCEDHFNLSEDSANWCFFKLMGEKLILKPDVLPHRYIHSPPSGRLSPQLSECARKKKLENLNILGRTATSREESLSKKRKESCLIIPPKSKVLKEHYSSSCEKFVITEDVGELAGYEYLGLDVSQQKQSNEVGIQVCIRTKNRSVETNTTPVLTKEAETMTNLYYVNNIDIKSLSSVSTSLSSEVT